MQPIGKANRFVTVKKAVVQGLGVLQQTGRGTGANRTQQSKSLYRRNVPWDSLMSSSLARLLVATTARGSATAFAQRLPYANNNTTLLSRAGEK